MLLLEIEAPAGTVKADVDNTIDLLDCEPIFSAGVVGTLAAVVVAHPLPVEFTVKPGLQVKLEAVQVAPSGQAVQKSFDAVGL